MCVRVSVCVCVCACVRECARVCVCVCVHTGTCTCSSAQYTRHSVATQDIKYNVAHFNQSPKRSTIERLQEFTRRFYAQGRHTALCEKCDNSHWLFDGGALCVVLLFVCVCVSVGVWCGVTAWIDRARCGWQTVCGCVCVCVCLTHDL